MIAYIYQAFIWSLDEKENWKRDGIEAASKEVADVFKVNHKKIIIPLLYAGITGKHFGPPLYDSFELLGRDRCRARFLQAIEFNGGISGKKSATLVKAWRDKDATEVLQDA